MGHAAGLADSPLFCGINRMGCNGVTPRLFLSALPKSGSGPLYLGTKVGPCLLAGFAFHSPGVNLMPPGLK